MRVCVVAVLLLLGVVFATPELESSRTEINCKDFDIKVCKRYADKGYCKNTAVAKYCPASCGKCPKVTRKKPNCKDDLKRCPTYAADGKCKFDRIFDKCGASCDDRCPKATPKPNCKDQLRRCQKFAEAGKCESARVFKYCGASCDDRCPKTTPKPNCKDKLKRCNLFAAAGKCKFDHVFEQCGASCDDRCPKTTPKPNCDDKLKRCQKYAEAGKCKTSRVFKYCGASCDDRCPKPTPTASTGPTASPSPTASQSPTASPSMTASPSPTAIPSMAPTAKPCGSKPIEVCFAADVFTSLGVSGWANVQFFIKNTILAVQSRFRIQPDLVSFAGVAFGTDVYATTQFTTWSSFTTDGIAVADFFNNISYQAGGSQIELALKRCRQAFVNPDVNRVVILITDGNGREVDGSPLPFRLIDKQADLLKDVGAELFSVAIAEGENASQLKKVSGKKDSNIINYTRIDKYKTKKSFSNYAEKLIACQ